MLNNTIACETMGTENNIAKVTAIFKQS